MEVVRTTCDHYWIVSYLVGIEERALKEREKVKIKELIDRPHTPARCCRRLICQHVTAPSNSQ